MTTVVKDEYWDAIERFLLEASRLIESYDPTSIKLFLDINPRSLSSQIFGKLKSGGVYDSHERTINGAGFKMFYEHDKDGRVTIRFGGDQAKNHPGAYIVLTMLLKKHGLLSDDRFDGQWEPLSKQWLYENLFNIEDWAWNWIRLNRDLIPKTMIR